MNAYGNDLLLHQLVDHVAGDWELLFDEAPGDSKIEKLLFRALKIRAWCRASEFSDLVIAHSPEDTERLMNDDGESRDTLRMIIQPQAPFDNRRVDFLIFAKDYRSAPPCLWRRLIIECDGHDFHERTKRQAARDRSKDRRATMEGIDFFRFTGSEIWRDPWGCAAEITDWAAAGLD